MLWNLKLKMEKFRIPLVAMDPIRWSCCKKTIVQEKRNKEILCLCKEFS